MESTSNPRQKIREAIAGGDLTWLLTRTGELHGHYCPGVAFGVRAGYRAVLDMGLHSSGMEEVVAIVETNNCFGDGIQFLTGCTFANNALIFRDFGKTAFTLAKRDGEGIRVSVDMERAALAEREPEAMQLFQKVVTNREGTEEDKRRLMELWRQASFNMLEVPDDELLEVKKVTAEIPSYARIFGSVRCSTCGENVMETRIRRIDDRPVCIPCSGKAYYELNGDGIHLRRR
jgi:formylmethanofuran dehydrogenase subunit E